MFFTYLGKVEFAIYLKTFSYPLMNILFVGWCSLLVDQATERYNVPCQQLHEGDICLPPYHPETTHTPIPVVTPDLTDAMKRSVLKGFRF